ncbi:MAG: ATP-dependent DNA helicase RecG, partial [Chloroflexota bacterium]|nr:ATP-dependent DNA helicase RecG [Chloroflexota bacterium]
MPDQIKNMSGKFNAEQIRKILELERAKGFADTAVSGGLDRFLVQLSNIDYESLSPPSPSYRALQREERLKWITETLARIPASSETRPQHPAKPAIPLDSPVTALKGISSKLAPRFQKLGVFTVRDLLYFFPRRHIDYSSPTTIANLKVGFEQTALVQVWQASVKKTRRGMGVTDVIVGDSSGTMRVTFFNQPFLARELTPNTRLALSGRVSIWKGIKTLQPTSFEIIYPDDVSQSGLAPVYSLTEGLYPRQMRRLVKESLNSCLPHLKDFLPEAIRMRAGLMELPEAIRQAHYPNNEPSKYAARRRLAFDELFFIQIGVLSKKRERQENANGIMLDAKSKHVERFLAILPFELTVAQKRALDETRADLTQDKPMSRLLHGDVGSGKTVVATAAMIQTVSSGCQAALMVPTEILAEQHFENICRNLGGIDEEGIIRSFDSTLSRPITVGLLTGSVRQKGKKELHQLISSGEIDILIGTQALIQKKVGFSRLGLVIVDEQHRFGVMQRLALREKGISPHMLVMSATPIPRTLALTVYGDLDISLIDELPPGRQPIKTKWLGPKQRKSGYDFVRKQVSEGRQAYVICPLVEESESIEAKAATSEYERLSQNVFPDLSLGLLHGRMAGSEKDEVMQQFRNGEIDVLVSTSVIEVGIDVPNATVMLVE